MNKRAWRWVAAIIFMTISVMVIRTSYAASGPTKLDPIQVTGPCAGMASYILAYGVLTGDEGCYASDLLNQGNSPSAGNTGSTGGGGSTSAPNNSTATTNTHKDKNPKCTNRSGDPIEVSQGSRTETLTLFSTPGEMGLTFQLFYVSPVGWSDTLSYWLDLQCGARLLPPPGIEPESTPQCSYVKFYRPDGSTIVFSGTPGTIGHYPESGGGGLATLVENSNGTYTLHDENADTLVFSSGGQLQSIVDSSGIGWSITNDAAGRPSKVTRTGGQAFSLSYQVNPTIGNNPATTTVTVTDPAGNVYQYIKQGMPDARLFHGPFEVDSVTFPGSPATTLTYKYATGNADISDLIETDINGVPYSYGTYNSNYEATGTRLADGSDAVSIVYAFPSGNTMKATVTNPLGHTTVDSYQFIDGQYLLTSVNDEAVSDCGATTHTAAYDSNGNLTQIVDNDGVATTYSYAVSGQLQTTTAAAGTAVARKTDYAWDSNLQLNRLLSVTVEGESRTSYTYNAQNRLASVTRTNLAGTGTPNQSLTTTYAYTLYPSGMVQTMTVTAPSPGGSDHTTSTYDTYGNLTSVTDGLGHVTTYSNYNGLGEVGKIVGPNGDETDYTYDARGRVASKTTHPNGTAATWTYAYDGFGLLAKETAPDGEITTWNRDAEKRVKTMTHNDRDGTSTETFTYDANNDVTSDVIARGSDIGKASYYAYDGLGRIYQVKGSNGQVLTYAYDGNGNVLSVTDALGHQTTYTYDGLNRLEGSMDAAGGVTSYAYDAGDHLTRVTDPRGLVTTYNYDGLGQLWKQASPDTGTTNFAYDGYGRLASKTRADGTQVTYAYDALNRLVSKVAGGITRTYTWDSCSNGKGRLCAAANEGYDNVAYAYTPEGQISARAFYITNGISYGFGYIYNSMGQLSVLGYPDGDQAIYDYRNGAVVDVRLKIGSTSTMDINNVTYRPMDMAMWSWTDDKGLTNTIDYDSDMRPDYIGVPNLQGLVPQYDAADRMIGLHSNTDGTLEQTFTYDVLNRLTGVSSVADNESFQYDADGNRTYQVVNGAATSFTYVPGSNRLASTAGGLNATYGYNADGDTVSIDGHTVYQYGPFDRLAGADGMSYRTSAEGQRLFKAGAQGTTYFAPNPDGTLQAEYTPQGLWLEYVWLNGRLVTVFTNTGGIYPVHADQTGRPQVVTDQNDTTVIWRAQNLAFRRNVTTNTFGDFNIGFPGQYYDDESGLWHNGARDYDASIGRYIESDPIGLAGGVNTYVYAEDDPISNIDPLGLYCLSQNQINAIAGAAGGAVSGGMEGSEGGLRGAAVGAGVGGLAGAAAGYFLPTTEMRAMGNGFIESAMSGLSNPLAGPFGGIIGAGVTRLLEEHGVNANVASVIGATAGGGAGGLTAGFLKYESQRLGLAGARSGLTGAGVSVVTATALEAGNSCGCGKN